MLMRSEVAITQPCYRDNSTMRAHSAIPHIEMDYQILKIVLDTPATGRLALARLSSPESMRHCMFCRSRITVGIDRALTMERVL
jgi:hypothetical protein